MLVPALAEHSTTLSFQRKQHSSDIKSGFLLTFPIKSNDLCFLSPTAINVSSDIKSGFLLTFPIKSNDKKFLQPVLLIWLYLLYNTCIVEKK